MPITVQPRHRMRGFFAAVASVVLLSSVFGAPRAAAANGANTVIADVEINDDGTLQVTQTVTLGAPHNGELTQTLATSKLTSADSDQRYQYTVSNVAARGGELATASQHDAELITIKGQNLTTFTVSYTVRGATYTNADGSVTVQWRPIQGFSFPIHQASVTVRTPAPFVELECHAGSSSAPRVCRALIGGREGHDLPEFHDGPLGTGEMLEMHVRFPANTVAATASITQDWSLDRAFSVTGWPLAAALVTALAGVMGLWWLARRAGHDAAFQTPTRIADFAPTGTDSTHFVLLESMRPGQAGTLSDEVVNPIDITATVIDMAQRGHLLITELPRDSAHAALDWTLTRRSCADELAPYEVVLLDLIAARDMEPTRVSTLAGTIQPGIGAVQDELYTAMVEQGWYTRRPDDTRNRVRMWGLGLVGAAVVTLIGLVLWTRFGLLGLVLIGLALGLIALAREIPARTARGASVLAGLHAFATELQTEPTDRMPQGREYAELGKVLPFAIVLGGRQRWLDALAAADDDADPDPHDLSWYHAPSTWNLADFPASMDALITTLTGKLFDRG